MSDTSGGGLGSGGTIDIGDLIISSFNRLKNSLVGASDDLGAAMGQGRSAIALSAKSAQDMASAATALNNSDAASLAQQAADNATASASFGTNPKAQSYIIPQMGERIRGEEQDIIGLQDKLNAQKESNFLDDPVQWISDLFSAPITQAALERRTGNLKQQFDVLHNLEAATGEQEKNNAIVDANTSAEKLVAVNAGVQAKAEAATASAQLEAAKLGVEGLKIRTALTSEQFDSVIKVQDAQAKEQTLPIQIEAEQTRLRVENLNLKLHSDDEAERQDTVRQVNAVRVAGGANPLTEQQLKILPSTMKEALLQAASGGPEGGFGATPYDSVRNMDVANLPGNPGLNYTRNKVVDLIAAAGTDATLQGKLQGASPAIKEAITNQYVLGHAQKELNGIPATGGLYSPGSLASVVTIPEVGKLPIAGPLAKLAAANPTYVANADTILGAGLGMIAKGESTPQDMAGQISRMYQALGSDLNSNRQYKKLAVPMLSQQTTGYKQSIVTSQGFGGKQVVDMMNESALRAVLTRRAQQVIQLKKANPSVPIEQLTGFGEQ